MRSLIKTKIKFIIVVLLCCCSIILPSSSLALNISDVPNPRVKNGTWVTDMANILTDKTENSINQSIERLEVNNGAEIAVVTVSETKPAKSPKEFTTKLFNTWKIGKKGQDNGVLFLVSVKDRRVEIETGYGVSNILSNKILSNIIQQEIVPNFQQGNFDKGVLFGTTQLVNILLQEGNQTNNIARRNTFFNYIPYQINFLSLFLGIVGGLYYFWFFFSKTKPVYVDPNGHSDKNISDELDSRKRQIYVLVYFAVVFTLTFIIAPVIASISREILFVGLVALHFYWLYKIIRQTPSFKNIKWLLFAPILFAVSCLLMQSVPTFCTAVIIAIIYSEYLNKQKSEGSNKSYIFRCIFSCILFGLVGFTINKSWQNPDEKGLLLLSLASSIAAGCLTQVAKRVEIR